MSCHPSSSSDKEIDRKNSKQLTVALAGNANVGKSVIFNQLTGSNQIIGNWPGKTVDRAEGSLCFENYDISVIDLPGIYSFSTFSLEEIVSRDYIALEKPDVVINVLDSAVLERNLFFTIQLIEMEVPLVVCLNQVDIAKDELIADRDRKGDSWLTSDQGDEGVRPDRLVRSGVVDRYRPSALRAARVQPLSWSAQGGLALL